MTDLKRILVIEDNQFLIKFILESENYEVVTANDGKQGYQEALNNKPDLIIMDLMMPKQNGFDTTSQLKSNPDMSTIPVIAVSAYSREEEKIKAIKSGCDDYITKPIDIETFLSTLGKWI